MVREFNEYEEPNKEGKKILEKTSKKSSKKSEPILHIVDQLPTQEVREVEEEGQMHNFITTQEAVTQLWNKIMK